MGNTIVLHTIYVVSWILIFATCTSLARFLRGEVDRDVVPRWLNKPGGRRYVLFASVLVLTSSVNLLFWGVLNIRWYLIPVHVVVGLVGGGIVRDDLFGVRPFILWGATMLLVLQMILWIH